ncbi:MAG: hypothetical protein FWG48_06680 [Oscillospiraceae bacterium]|nr:hypothetical protein [Oscillospiraceae bacterium]
MSPENQKKYDEKEQRVKDAIALKEPDRVPVTPPAELFPIFNAGFTVAEVVYDTTLEKSRTAAIKYLNDFDPDSGTGVGMVNAGEGPAMEITRPKNMRWAGMPGNVIDDNSLQQFIEYPLLLDDEFEEFFSDRTGWTIGKSLPRNYAIYEPFEKFREYLGGMGGVRRMASLFSSPEFRSMISDLWAVDEFYKSYQDRVDAINQEIHDMGYPVYMGGGAGVPYDGYSDFLRGSILTMEDLYERPQDIERYIDEALERSLEMIARSKGINEGKHFFMALHKGFDGFLSGEHYRKYYWSHLQKIILAIIDSGHVPYIYTEGKYDSRIDCLTEVPPGKVFYHFEEVDMAVAKKKLGGIACISGGFPSAMLDWSTPDKVRDAVKKLMDDCAPGGGYIFETSCGLGKCKRENVEAMFETAREYGAY